VIFGIGASGFPGKENEEKTKHLEEQKLQIFVQKFCEELQ
jgi:hypothetical protein